jgi:hypothetical protein
MPNGLFASFLNPHSAKLKQDQPRTSFLTVPGGTRKLAELRFCERLGKRNLYCVSSSIHMASSFVEPRTPVIYGGECQDCATTKTASKDCNSSRVAAT